MDKHDAVTLTKHLFIPVLLLGLAACGGSGSGNEEPTQPPEAPSLTLGYGLVKAKTFGFQWQDVSGETEYRLLENPDGISGFVTIATLGQDIDSHEIQVFLPSRLSARYLLQACNSAGCSDSNEVAVNANTMNATIGYLKASNPDVEDRFGFNLALSGDGSTMVVGVPSEDGSGSSESDNSMPGAGAVYVFLHEQGIWAQQAYIKAFNADAGDGFGVAISLSDDGNTLAVAAIGEASASTNAQDNSAPYAGAVYIYTREAESWSQQAYIKASIPGAGDFFGESIALSADGNTLAVGASLEDIPLSGIWSTIPNFVGTGSDIGAVYIYARDGSNWNPQAYVKPYSKDDLDRFGQVVALSADGNTLAIGTGDEDSSFTGILDLTPDLILLNPLTDNNASAAGAVYILTRSGEEWSWQAFVKASNADAGDGFGTSVALSGTGDTLAVGAEWEDGFSKGVNGDEDSDLSPQSGAVYVYVRSEGTWSKQAYIKASNADIYDNFGWAVGLSSDGNTLVVGAPNEDGSSTGLTGSAADNSAEDAGALYLYRRDDGFWSQQAYIKATNSDVEDYFGSALAISADGSVLAVGSPGEDSNNSGFGGAGEDNSASGSGAVYLY